MTTGRLKLSGRLSSWADLTEELGHLPNECLGLCELFVSSWKDLGEITKAEYFWLRSKLHEHFGKGKARSEYYWELPDWPARVRALRTLSELAKVEGQ